jgi:3'-5' exonuclease
LRKIVFDIETCCFPFETLSESQQEYILRYAEKERDSEVREQRKEEAVRYLNLYPFTAKVIAIGILDILKEKRFVYYESAVEEEFFSAGGDIHFKGLSESSMIESFWRIAEVADQVVSFNGRSFDAPFLLIRSAINKIKPTRNLVPNRYDNFHIDLLEQFTFFGLTRKFNLDFYCRAFGIESPKTAEINGNEVQRFYREGKIKDIAKYCADDISATYELYKVWNEYLNITEK